MKIISLLFIFVAGFTFAVELLFPESARRRIAAPADLPPGRDPDVGTAALITDSDESELSLNPDAGEAEPLITYRSYREE